MIPFLQDLVLKDFWLKLFSLALAVLMWFTMDLSIRNQVSPGAAWSPTARVQRAFSSLPVMILSSAEDVRSVRVFPKEVEVTVQGDSETIRKLQSKDIRVLLDMTGIPAAHDFRKRVEVSTPAGVTYVKIDPEEVQVTR